MGKKKMFALAWFERFAHKMETNELTMDDLRNLIDEKCQRLLENLYGCAKDVFDRDAVENERPCSFVFHGADIIIDERGKFYLLEVNRAPSLSLIGHETIKQMTRNMLGEAIDICLEIRQLKVMGVRVHQHTRLQSVHFWKRCRLDYPMDAVDRIDALLDDLNCLG